MKIVHVLLTHTFAGTERYVIELANAQAAAHDVTVILHRRAMEDRPDALGHRFDKRVKLLAVGGLRFLAVLGARRWVKALAPDVAHAHLSGGCRALHGLRGVCRRVATLHIHYKPRQHRDLDALIAIAPWQLEKIPADQRSKVAQIDNWSMQVVGTREAGLALRRAHGIPDSAFVVGALGRSEHSKGLDLLLGAYTALAPDADVRLVIVGQGRDWDALRRQAPADVVMPGFTDKPHDWLAGFDAFASAARSEPFGLVFLEAMAAGLPILATGSQGATHFSSLIERPLVPVNDGEALKEGLKNLLQERPVRRRYDLEKYSIARALLEIDAFYTRAP